MAQPPKGALTSNWPLWREARDSVSRDVMALLGRVQWG
jgi:hypothetical protein